MTDLPDIRTRRKKQRREAVNHPAHYGGSANPYEAIKVIEAWDLGFRLGNAVKYISRADHKGNRLEDLEKAVWYLNREIEALKMKEARYENRKTLHADDESV